MKKLDRIVDLYLQMETNNALLITGDWGVGKTYYLNNVLFRKMSSTKVMGDVRRRVLAFSTLILVFQVVGLP